MKPMQPYGAAKGHNRYADDDRSIERDVRPARERGRSKQQIGEAMKAEGQSRAFARYVGLGALHLDGLTVVARRHGMKIIQAYKPGMHFFYELALWGTPAQMKATEADWSSAKKKHEDGSESKAGKILSKKPSAAIGVNLSLPREKWVDREIVSVGTSG